MFVRRLPPCLRPRRARRCLQVIGLLAVPAVCPAAAQPPATEDTVRVDVPMTTQVAPDFSLPTMAGDTFRLSAHRGRVVVVNVWATWCGPCRAEMPMFVGLQEELGPHGLTFVGVSIDEGGWDVVRPFATRIGVNYPLVLDDGFMAQRFGASGIMPMTYVVDRAGRLRVVAEGAVSRAELRPILRSLLAE